MAPIAMPCCILVAAARCCLTIGTAARAVAAGVAFQIVVAGVERILREGAMSINWLGFTPGESFGTVLHRYRGVAPGFDLLRLLLAVTIFVAHARWLSGAPGMDLTGVATHQRAADPLAWVDWNGGPLHGLWKGPLRPVKLALVPAFFALSGFLITRSAQRIRHTGIWLSHRALRIFPALIVEVMLSAFILGPLFTTLPLASYFGADGFVIYFGNIVGVITYYLPGVFVNNPVPHYVNMSLWTLQAEFYSYLVVAVLMMSGVLRARRAFAAMFLMLTAGLVVLHAATGYSTPVNGPFSIHVIVYYCLLGAFCAVFADRLPARPGLFLLSIPLAYVLLLFDSTVYLATVPLTYATLFFGLLPVPPLSRFVAGDYSYGIYLYGFPITQALMALAPGLLLQRPTLLIVAAFTVTLLFAMASWRLIERRALSLKPRAHAGQTTSTKSAITSRNDS